jgi:hypothetical protein
METRDRALLDATRRKRVQLGKLMLYQLSYVRAPPILAISTRSQLSSAGDPEFKFRHGDKRRAPQARGSVLYLHRDYVPIPKSGTTAIGFD